MERPVVQCTLQDCTIRNVNFVDVLYADYLSNRAIGYWFLGRYMGRQPFIFQLLLIDLTSMNSGHLGIEDFISEHKGRLMILVSLPFFFIGMLWLNGFGTMLSAAGFFVGILLVAYGFLDVLGFFSVKWRSIAGLGVILIVAAITFLAISLGTMEFQTLVLAGYRPVIFKGAIISYQPVMHSYPTFLWLTEITVELTLLLFAAGIILRIYAYIK